MISLIPQESRCLMMTGTKLLHYCVIHDKGIARPDNLWFLSITSVLMGEFSDVNTTCTLYCSPTCR